MKNKVLLVYLAMALMVSLVAANRAAPAPKEEFKWRIQCAFGATDSAYYVDTVGIAQVLEEGSGGRIKCDTFPGGQLVGSEEMFAATKKGAIEAGVNMASSAAGVIPGVVTVQLPTAAQDYREQHELLYKWGLIGKLRPAFAKHKLHLLAAVYAGALGFQSTFAVNTLDDLKGKKAWNNAILTPGFKNLGIVPTFIPGFDMYTALKLGTLDAIGWTLVELESAKYKEVVKYMMLPRIGLGVNIIYINMDDWNALGSGLQKQVQDYVDSKVLWLGEWLAGEEEKAVAAAKEYGVKFIKLTDADVARFNQVHRKHWDKLAQKSSLAAECVQINKDFVKSKRRW